jgi:hypothetical protein
MVQNDNSLFIVTQMRMLSSDREAPLRHLEVPGGAFQPQISITSSKNKLLKSMETRDRIRASIELSITYKKAPYPTF